MGEPDSIELCQVFVGFIMGEISMRTFYDVLGDFRSKAPRVKNFERKIEKSP
jgi:hypothetical protein